MKKWLKRLFSKEKDWVYGWDFGNVDKSVFTKGYYDKKGVFHIVEVKEFDNSK
ncbi:hypothetical protein [Metabacillus sp. Hm71]|uniref:hypothetical protein n=1 Tax=Metabacillus sp. Hm71 TaxID=3450743 RepID=UPI003F4256A0